MCVSEQNRGDKGCTRNIHPKIHCFRRKLKTQSLPGLILSNIRYDRLKSTSWRGIRASDLTGQVVETVGFFGDMLWFLDRFDKRRFTRDAAVSDLQ